MFRTLERDQETGLGLPYPVVLLNAAEEEIDPETGARVGVAVPDMEGLIATVAVTRALIPLALDGAEARFMRQVLGMTATALAEALSLDKATLSRWENNRQSMGEWADKQIRLFVLIRLADRVKIAAAEKNAIIAMHILPGEHHTLPVMEFELHTASASQTGECVAGWDRLRLAA